MGILAFLWLPCLPMQPFSYPRRVWQSSSRWVAFSIRLVLPYLAGFSGQGVVERTEIYDRFLPIIQKYGVWAILVLSAIPNPLFDLAGVAAGVTKIPVWRFLLFCWIGQIIKMAAFAFAGMYSIDWVSNLFK